MNQSLSEVMQNQSILLITFDTALVTQHLVLRRPIENREINMKLFVDNSSVKFPCLCFSVLAGSYSACMSYLMKFPGGFTDVYRYVKTALIMRENKVRFRPRISTYPCLNTNTL